MSESHPFEPFLPTGTRLLICGTFPPAANRWSMNFYYPNYINDMWRVFSLLFYNDKDYLVDIPNKTFHLDRIKALLTEKRIGFSDTGREAVRLKGNAADKFLEIQKPIPLADMLATMPEFEALATTGEKAAGVIADITGTDIPKMGEFAECSIMDSSGKLRKFRHWRMPSTSRAYPMPLAKKAEYYGLLLRSLNML